jgi:chromosome partitioning protein
MLGDVDRQQSTGQWLALRPPQLPAISGWDLVDHDVVRPPKGSSHVVLDTPAGLRGKRLDAVLKITDLLLVPLQPSPFDMAATRDFIASLREHKRFDRLRIGLVATRVKEHTHAVEHLREFLATLDQPLVTELRDTQNYVHLAARGLTLWDVAAGRVERDLAQWQALTDWLSRNPALE